MKVIFKRDYRSTDLVATAGEEIEISECKMKYLTETFGKINPDHVPEIVKEKIKKKKSK